MLDPRCIASVCTSQLAPVYGYAISEPEDHNEPLGVRSSLRDGWKPRDSAGVGKRFGGLVVDGPETGWLTVVVTSG